jgi:paired small multidrug resistance pump
MGIAYTIWVGIAVIGTTIAESYLYESTYNFTKLFFVALILAGAVGLKLTSTGE